MADWTGKPASSGPCSGLRKPQPTPSSHMTTATRHSRNIAIHESFPITLDFFEEAMNLVITIEIHSPGFVRTFNVRSTSGLPERAHQAQIQIQEEARGFLLDDPNAPNVL